jgi:chromosome segregation ATPase
MWDSNDPMRNPPPLPLSPQMLRSTKNSPTKASNGSPIGKFHLSPVDAGEIEFQLQKLVESQGSIKGLLQSIDTSVKHTQIDLESLNDRSSNNNSRLKDLLESVASSSDSENQIMQEKIHEIFTKSLEPVTNKLSGIDNIRSEIISKLLELHNNPSEEPDKVIQELSAVKDQLSALASNQSSREDIKQLKEAIKDMNHDELRGVITANQEEVKATLKGLLRAVEDFDTRKIIESMKESHESHESLHSKVESIQEALENTRSTQVLQEFLTQKLNDLSQCMEVQQESSNKNIENLLNKLDRNTDVEPIKKFMSHELSNLIPDLSSHIETVLGQFLLSNKTLVEEKTSGIEVALQKMKTLVESKQDELLQSIGDVNSNIVSSIGENLKITLEKKDLELSLKDKEIADLKEQISEMQAKLSIQESILELSQQHTKLTTRLECLKETYSNRYNDLKQLNKEYEEISEKLLKVSTDKLQSIMNASKFSNLSGEEQYIPMKPVGTRVLSTNSYLMNTNTLLKSRSQKSYQLQYVEANDNSDEDITSRAYVHRDVKSEHDVDNEASGTDHVAEEEHEESSEADTDD